MALSKQELSGMVKELQAYWVTRKMEMVKLWDFYYGELQKIYMSPFEGETVEEYESRVDRAVIENHCAKTADVIVGYLYGQPNAKSRVTVRICDKDGNIIPELQELFKNRFWPDNDMDSFRIDVGLMASVTGFALTYKEFVDRETMLPFKKSVSTEDKRKYGTIRYDIFDSVDTMLIPRTRKFGDSEVVYPRLLGAVLRMYSQQNSMGGSYYDKLLGRRQTEDNYFEYFDDENFYRLTVAPDGSTPSDTSWDVTPNKYGRLTVPFTLFRNYGDPMYLEGDSDIAPLIDLQNGINELSNDDKRAIHYHSFPLLVLKGTKLPSNFTRKVNSALELESPDDVAEYLTWDNVLEASLKKQEDMRRQMTVTGGVSQISRGNATDIGQIKSGAGLKTLFQADINEISLKIPLFKRAEKELVQSTIRMWATETGMEVPEYYCHVDFPEDFVGIDELLKAQTDQLELEGWATVREKVKKYHPEAASEEEIDALVKEFFDDKKKLAKAEASTKPQTPEKKSQEQTPV